MEAATGPIVIGPDDGKLVTLQTVGVRYMIDGAETDSRFSLVEHPIPPRSLAAPLHRHSREDEYSFVLEGRMGAELGGQVVHAEPGDLVFKPRDQWHTFWNAGDAPARILELISPSGFELFFQELSEIVVDGVPDESRFGPLRERYGLEMDMESVPRLVDEHGLRFPGPPPG
jgi:mannose-6-phosphate isomerase-like protein (cupin superfamily)